MVGQSISHYRVLEKIGGGGMGLVYRAEDTMLGRFVALKFLPDAVADDSQALERFRREARAASALNHPNICTIHEIANEGGKWFIAMELIEGVSLDYRIAGRPIPLPELLSIGVDLTDALETAHNQGIIHRDIKSSNVVLTKRGHPKILDFGLAKLDPARASSQLKEDDDVTITTSMMGTVAYMSPEQISGMALDNRTDLFSLGVVLYEMATGQQPFRRATIGSTFGAILHEAPTPPGRLNEKLPPKLVSIINRSLEKNRELRYQSAAQIREDLQLLKAELDPVLGHAAGPSLSQPSVLTGEVRLSENPTAGINVPTLRQRAKPGRWKLVISACVLLVAAAGFYYVRHRPQRLAQKDTVVLAEFENLTGDPVFDDTLKQTLSIALRQSPFLNVLSDMKVSSTLQMMMRPADLALSPEIAREVCQRAGSKALINGRISPLGNHYVIALNAVNCQTGDILGQQQVVSNDKEHVLNALGDAASRLRHELGESLASVQRFDVPLSQATTSSFEALKAFSLGVRAGLQKSTTQSIAYYQKAVELDPNFAAAYRGLASSYASLAETGRASEYLGKAFELRQHTSEREKLVIAADYYRLVSGELDKAAQTYQEWIENYPSDDSAYNSLAITYASLGQYDKAAEANRQALSLAPDVGGPYMNLGNSLLAQQQLAEAAEIEHSALARQLDDSVLRSELYAVAFLKHDESELSRQSTWFLSQPDFEHFGFALESDTAAYSGHLRQARDLTRRAVESAVRTDNKENAGVWQENSAIWESAFGNRAAAQKAALQGMQLAPTSQGVLLEAALALAMAGDTSQANSLTQKLDRLYPVDTQVQSLWLPTIQGQISLNLSRAREAIDRQQASIRLDLAQIQFVNNLSCLYSDYVRGTAYLQAGDGASAVAEFNKIIEHSGLVWNCWTGALAHLGVARASVLEAKNLSSSGSTARVRALAAYKQFLELWKDADPDIPILKEAKAEYAKLQ
ncbi:MAG TPA: protein kinase [Candidatus Sulfotelmatobacter sp.]|nr:protein kinase [Candidatus Sulfotelmatobacter sp.]